MRHDPVGGQSLRIYHRRTAFRPVLRGQRPVVIASVRGAQPQRIIKKVRVRHLPIGRREGGEIALLDTGICTLYMP